jgi:hypothetical protein
MAHTPRIHVLVVGINKYPIAHHCLNGCVNDAKSLVAFLEGQYPCERLNIKEVYDDQATRQGVIDAFGHFDAAVDGDTCLFYYSGHGSQTPGPAEFLHLDPDGMLESMVCYDSRIADGRDLMDKEISYLIWKATHGKQLHFVTLFDCCHSGEIDRDVSVRSRMAEPARVPGQLRDFLGIESYQETQVAGARRYSPPVGSHIQLAAARSNETAKEMLIEGQPRGVFTYSLLNVLAQHPGAITYEELIAHLRARVAAKVGQQTPQLAAGEDDKRRLFLGQAMQQETAYVVSYDTVQNAWYANAGQVHGLPMGEPAAIIFELEVGGEVIPAIADKVELQRCRLSGLDHLPHDPATHRAVLASAPYARLRVAVDEAAPAAARAALNQGFKDYPSISYAVVEDALEADYLIRAIDNQLSLTLPGDQRPVFRRAKGYKAESVGAFLENVEKVAKWERVKSIHNPNTSITDDQFELKWLRVKDPISWDMDEDDNPPTESLDWKQPQVFSYQYNKNEDDESLRWRSPGFQLYLRNTSRRTLFFSVVNLEATFRVSNRFLAQQELGPGEEVWIMDRPEADAASDPYAYRTIPLGIDDKLLAQGVSETSEYLKVFISTQEISTDSFVQKPLAMDENWQGVHKAGRDAAQRPARHDWRVVDLTMTVSRPGAATKIKGGQAAKVGGALKLQLPAGCEATAALNARQAAARNLGNDRLPDTIPGWTLRSLGSGMANASPPAVLELFEVSGRDLVNADHPAMVWMEEPPLAGELIVPVAYDEATGLFYPIGTMNEDGSLNLDYLPEPTAEGTRSLGGSIKIFFQKTIGQYLPMAYNHPQLAVATVTPRESGTGASAFEMTYETDAAVVKAKVAQASRIALFIHGVIGDTTEMPKSLYLAADSAGKPLADRYDLILTFDYENLNTEIQKTAQELKEKLENAGLGAGHGKTLHIFAHSMGGLVSRWMIEKEDGNQMVSRLFQFGTPNQGSPLSSVYEMTTVLLTYAVNGAAFLQPYLATLRIAGKWLDKLFVTLEQMSPSGKFLKEELNDSTDPGVPYSIIAGNTRLIPVAAPEKQASLLKKVLSRFKQRGHYDALDLLLFKSPNDIAVTVESIKAIPGGESRQYPPQTWEAACDHMAYFAAPAGLAVMVLAIEAAEA